MMKCKKPIDSANINRQAEKVGTLSASIVSETGEKENGIYKL